MGQPCAPGKGQEVVLEEINFIGHLLNVSDGVQVSLVQLFSVYFLF